MKKVLISTMTHDAKNYREALLRVGMIPILSGELEDAENYDGLLLPGGGDISPILFHQKNTGSVHISLTEDIIQLMVLTRFLDLHKPVLGICKGMQLINVAYGGTLVQDIPLKGIHEFDEHDRYHKTRALPGFALHKIYGEHFITNSAHHQSVDLLGHELIATQYSYDGIIEGLEHQTDPVIGVQWHPERLLKHPLPASSVNGTAVFTYFQELLQAQSP